MLRPRKKCTKEPNRVIVGVLASSAVDRVIVGVLASSAVDRVIVGVLASSAVDRVIVGVLQCGRSWVPAPIGSNQRL